MRYAFLIKLGMFLVCETQNMSHIPQWRQATGPRNGNVLSQESARFGFGQTTAALEVASSCQPGSFISISHISYLHILPNLSYLVMISTLSVYTITIYVLPVASQAAMSSPSYVHYIRNSQSQYMTYNLIFHITSHLLCCASGRGATNSPSPCPLHAPLIQPVACSRKLYPINHTT